MRQSLELVRIQHGLCHIAHTYNPSVSAIVHSTQYARTVLSSQPRHNAEIDHKLAILYCNA